MTNADERPQTNFTDIGEPAGTISEPAGAAASKPTVRAAGADTAAAESAGTTARTGRAAEPAGRAAVEPAGTAAGTARAASKPVKAIKAVLFLALLSLLLLLTSRLMARKTAYIRTQPFLDETANVDVLFLGTSHTIDGIYPMELWRDYGISSYNLGQTQCTMAVAYWVLQEALRYTEPKVVVLDCSRMRMSLKTSQDFPMVFQALDGFPLSRTKIAAAEDLLDDPRLPDLLENGKVTADDAQLRSKKALLFNLLLYHSRWKELTQEDFEPELNVQKGSSYMINVATPADVTELSDDDILKRNTAGIDYVRRIVSECRERGIEVVLTYLPFPADAAQQREANRAAFVAEECGVPYLNFLRMDVVDFDTDLYDSVSHLNASGARKITSYLGQYLRDNYGVADHRGETAYEDWNGDYEQYAAFKDAKLAEATELANYLMLLSDRTYDAVIELGQTEFLKNGRLAALLENLGVDITEVKDGGRLIIRGGQSVGSGGAAADGEQAGSSAQQTTTHAQTDDTQQAAGSLLTDSDKQSAGSGGAAADGEQAGSSAQQTTTDAQTDDTQQETASLPTDKNWLRIRTTRADTGETVDEVEFHYSVKSDKTTETIREDTEAAKQ